MLQLQIIHEHFNFPKSPQCFLFPEFLSIFDINMLSIFYKHHQEQVTKSIRELVLPGLGTVSCIKLLLLNRKQSEIILIFFKNQQ